MTIVFRDLRHLALHWEVTIDGVVTQAGTLDNLATPPDREFETINVPYAFAPIDSG